MAAILARSEDANSQSGGRNLQDASGEEWQSLLVGRAELARNTALGMVRPGAETQRLRFRTTDSNLADVSTVAIASQAQ